MNTEIQRLLNATLDDGLMEADAKRLEELLRTQAGREQYSAFIKLHLELSETVTPVRSFSAEELQAVANVDARFQDRESADREGFGLGDEVETNPHEATPTVNRALQPKSQPAVASRWLAFAAGLAASLLIVLPSAWQYYREREPLVGPDAQASATVQDRGKQDPQPDSAAVRIVKKIDCVWDSDRWTVSSPVSLSIGERIRLSSGLLAMEFKSGALVTLQGPASISPTSDNSLILFNGGMTATVPEEATGFTVHTSSGEIVDLGTEFGVFARADGSLETHVFKGKVVTRLGGNNDLERPEVAINAGEAQLVSSVGKSSTARAQRDRFLRLGFGMDADRLTPPPVGRGLVLWLAADGRIQLDERGRVMAWGDNPADNNETLEDAWQIHGRYRPQWTSNAINGRPALRFGGDRLIITEPIELGTSLTNVIVFRFNSDKVPSSFVKLRRTGSSAKETRPDLGLQLLNLYGPPHPVIQVSQNLNLKARVHLGSDPENLYANDTGVVKSQPISDDAPHVLAYTIDSVSGMARLYIDGEVVGEATEVAGLISTFTPRYIGQHPYRSEHGFPGDIAEVVVHDAALDANEVSVLTSWLAQKYGIPTPAATTE